MPNRRGIDRPVGVVLALVSLAVLQAMISFRECRDIDFPGNYDTAYYFTVARNLAMGRGVTESMNWHYLGPEQPIARPAGDCWMVGWPIALGTLMVGFGHSGTDALRICAGLSVLLPMLAFRLSWGLRPRIATSALAGLMVCAQSRLYQTNVTPDVTLSYQLLVLFALGTAVNALRAEGKPARWAFVGLALCLPMWVRGEGFVGLIAVGLTLLVWGNGDRRGRLIGVGWLFFGAICGLAPLFGYHLTSFGRLNPLPRSLTFWVREIDELYTLDTDPSIGSWLSMGARGIVHTRIRCLIDLTYHLMIQIPWPLLVSAAAGIVSGLARRRVEVLCLSLFLVLSAVVPTALVPPFTNPDRLVMHSLPILCVLAASAFGDVFASAGWQGSAVLGNPGIDVARSFDVDPGVAAGAADPCHPGPAGRHVKLGRGRGVAIVVCGVMGLACCFVPARYNAQGHYEHGWKVQFRPVPSHLATAVRDLGLKPDDVVLTQDPWQVAAVLDVRTVMIPLDGRDAMKRVVDFYQPRFLLLADKGSKEANAKIAGGQIDDRFVEDLGFRPVSRVGVYRWFLRSGGKP